MDGAGGAGSIRKLEELRKADADLLAEVEDAPRIAGDSADTQSLVIDLVPCALSANSTDRVVSSDAAADAVVEYFIDSTSDYA